MIEKQNDLKEVIVHLRTPTGAPAGPRDLSGTQRHLTSSPLTSCAPPQVRLCPPARSPPPSQRSLRCLEPLMGRRDVRVAWQYLLPVGTSGVQLTSTVDSATSATLTGGNMVALNCLLDGVGMLLVLYLLHYISFGVCFSPEASDKKAGVMTAAGLLQRKLNKGQSSFRLCACPILYHCWLCRPAIWCAESLQKDTSLCNCQKDRRHCTSSPILYEAYSPHTVHTTKARWAESNPSSSTSQYSHLPKVLPQTIM